MFELWCYNINELWVLHRSSLQLSRVNSTLLQLPLRFLWLPTWNFQSKSTHLPTQPFRFSLPFRVSTKRYDISQDLTTNWRYGAFQGGRAGAGQAGDKNVIKFLGKPAKHSKKYIKWCNSQTIGGGRGGGDLPQGTKIEKFKKEYWIQPYQQRLLLYLFIVQEPQSCTRISRWPYRQIEDFLYLR